MNEDEVVPSGTPPTPAEAAGAQYRVVVFADAAAANYPLPPLTADWVDACQWDGDLDYGIWRFEGDTPVEFIGQDGGEPEDQTMRRAWSWVAPALCAAFEAGRRSPDPGRPPEPEARELHDAIVDFIAADDARCENDDEVPGEAWNRAYLRLRALADAPTSTESPILAPAAASEASSGQEPGGVAELLGGGSAAQTITTAYDPIAKAAYIRLGNGSVATTSELTGGINADWDITGGLVGIEVYAWRRSSDTQNPAGAEAIRALVERVQRGGPSNILDHLGSYMSPEAASLVRDALAAGGEP